MNASDLFGEEVKLIKRPDAYPAMPGTGPQGKQCRHCDNFVQRTFARKVSKCRLTEKQGAQSTDINMYSAACSRFVDHEAIEES